MAKKAGLATPLLSDDEAAVPRALPEPLPRPPEEAGASAEDGAREVSLLGRQASAVLGAVGYEGMNPESAEALLEEVCHRPPPFPLALLLEPVELRWTFECDK